MARYYLAGTAGPPCRLTLHSKCCLLLALLCPDAALEQIRFVWTLQTRQRLVSDACTSTDHLHHRVCRELLVARYQAFRITLLPDKALQCCASTIFWTVMPHACRHTSQHGTAKQPTACLLVHAQCMALHPTYNLQRRAPAARCSLLEGQEAEKLSSSVHPTRNWFPSQHTPDSTCWVTILCS